MKRTGGEQMNKDRKSKFILLLLMILFFMITLATSANATPEKSAAENKGNELNSVEDSQWSKWKEAHTVEVDVTTVYDYEKDGTLKVTETYSGEKLKRKYNEDKLTKSHTLSIPDGAEIAVSAESGSSKLKPGETKVFVTQESIVLTAANTPYAWWDRTSLTTSSAASSAVSSTSFDYPQWTFSKVTSLFKTYYKMEDPINLVWKENNLKTVKSVILNHKWVDNPVEYTHYLPYPDGKWVAGDGIADSKYRLSGGYHLRLWELPGGSVVSNAHHDDNVLIIPGHQVDGYENAEAKVAGFFGTPCGSCWLDNVYTSSYYNAYNDGNAALYVKN
jgi:hypothetical protein